VNRKLLLIVLSTLLLASAASAQVRILLVGDSWVDQAFAAGAFDTALANRGFPSVSSEGSVTAIGGTTAAQWATAPFLALITSELAAYPTIDIVHLSMGGNDFLGAPPGTDIGVLAAQILGDIDTVVSHIHGIDPAIRVTLASYDYTPIGFNTEAGLLTQAVIDQAALVPNFWVINNLGLLHHAFGYPGEFLPGETPLPGSFPTYTPLLGGDPAFPGHPDFFDDSIHPSDPSYVRLAEHAIDEFYASFLTAQAVPGLGVGGLALLLWALARSGAASLRDPRAS